jgi:hypothetical protein
MQGARIGAGCYMDSLDVCDFDLITIGDNVAVNEGSTIMCHFFQDGALHFSEARAASRQLLLLLLLQTPPCSPHEPWAAERIRPDLGDSIDVDR